MEKCDLDHIVSSLLVSHGPLYFCLLADPVINEVLKEFDSPEDILIKCTVGNRQRYVHNNVCYNTVALYLGLLLNEKVVFD